MLICPTCGSLNLHVLVGEDPGDTGSLYCDTCATDHPL